MSDTTALYKNLYILENEDSPYGNEPKQVYPPTTLDQVFDDGSIDNKTLRTIIAEIYEAIKSGGEGSIVFPVTSVNDEQGDVKITQDSLGMGMLDLTRDIDKPLSNPQRAAIMTILKNYDFGKDIDLHDLYEHIANQDNPHGVTMDQINKDNAIDELISIYLTRHNASTSEDTHRDIRNKLSLLTTNIDDLNKFVENRIALALETLNNHTIDTGAHADLFDKKEDESNKTTVLDDLSDHKMYPSARAVVEYVMRSLIDFKSSLNIVDNWIDDIKVIDDRTKLPQPSVTSFRKAYFILHGGDNKSEVAVCRKNDDNSYSWEVESLDTYTVYDPAYFVNGVNGLALNDKSIAEILLNEDTIVDRLRDTFLSVVPQLLVDYYTKEEINSFHYISQIDIIPGTEEGTIRYYINGNQETMSKNVFIGGLKKLAFLDQVTEEYIADNAVESRAIGNRVVQERHMANQAVAAANMKGSYMTMFGNFEDVEGTTVREVTLRTLAEHLVNNFKDIIEEEGGIFPTRDGIREVVQEEIKDFLGWVDPTLHASFKVDSYHNIFIDYDQAYGEPDIKINDVGNVILNSNDTDTDHDIEKFRFNVENDDLIMTLMN